MKKKVNAAKIFAILEKYYPPHVMNSKYYGEPYKVLVSCILSLRNLDEVTFPVAEKLFKIADNPDAIAKMPLEQLKKEIKSINFYITKAQTIKNITDILIAKYNGQVPSDMDKLLAFKGVGRKTANIVRSVGYKMPVIAVDVHVHRISNRLGLVKTKEPEETEFALMKIISEEYRRKINQLFVLHGKSICKSRKPLCNVCPIIDYCNQINVNF
jgi:endonuclease III